jgi:nucleotide-binding universal stress UspA family protein
LKKALIALDGSVHSERAVAYAAAILPYLPGCEVILLALTGSVPEGSLALDPAAPAPEVHGDQDHQPELTRLRTALAAAADQLQNRGFPADRLEARLRSIRTTVAEDILAEATTASCDTVVVGRRGLSRLGELIAGSVSSGLVHQAADLTVWVVE